MKLSKKNEKKITRMNEVWNKFIEHVEGDNENVEYAFEAFDQMLDELGSNDFFGTESQCDPRGDGRDCSDGPKL